MELRTRFAALELKLLQVEGGRGGMCVRVVTVQVEGGRGGICVGEGGDCAGGGVGWGGSLWVLELRLQQVVGG